MAIITHFFCFSQLNIRSQNDTLSSMTDTNQSISDLLHADAKNLNDDTTLEGKFEKKQKEIQAHDLERMTSGRAAAVGLSYVDLSGFPISQEALALIPETEARELNVVCFYFDGSRLRLAALDPLSPAVQKKLHELEKMLSIRNAETYLVSSKSLEHGLWLYRSLPKIKAIPSGVEITEENLEKFKNEIDDFASLATRINEVNMSDVIVLLIAASLKVESSDIHIEAEESGVIVRLRVDGILQQAAVISREKWRRTISRLKVLAKVKINVEDKPQDGRFTIFTSKEKIAVRASFLPTAFGESVVMRLLHSSAVSLSFDSLGLRPRELKILREEIEKPNGLILVTGPTGSGKTTTLYAALNYLNRPGTKIITLEDPIEYQLERINQSQVDESKGFTFSTGLRSVLRQDPDIVMIGEMRDLETAEISVRAALTGHLVLSTVHTNDAAGAIPRMLDLGVKPYLLTPAMNVVVGQRLVRKLCPHCKTIKETTEEELNKVRRILAVISPKAGVDTPGELPPLYGPVGCDQCAGLGYKGRIGIYEILVMSQKIKELSSANASSLKILEQAVEDGMLTMLQDGMLKCLDGITSLDEVMSVAGKMEYIDALYDIVVSQAIGHGLTISDEELADGRELIRDLKEDHGTFLKSKHTEDMFKVILAGALAGDAGDVNIDPTEHGVNIRYRVDGLLHDVATLESQYYIPLLSEIKGAAGIATNVKKPTYDGRFSVKYSNQKIDCRLSIIMGGYGEAVAIRLLSNQAKSLDMKELGLAAVSFDIVNRSIHKTKGIIFTTGPTGSGKTTTLYSILNAINDPSVKIITIEDPIEYNLEGIVQTQINTEEGYTFAAALRSLLRQNPNVIMVGEIRDEETAKIAVEAALTGHLVLSTIHANSAAGAIARFVGLGVEKSLLASAIECSIGQRLVRRLCTKCKKITALTPELQTRADEIIARLKARTDVTLPTEFSFYAPVGCHECGGLGYKGRVGIYEAIELSSNLEKLIQAPTVTEGEIEDVARQEGSLLMLEDGILKALAGETTVDEIFRVAS